MSFPRPSAVRRSARRTPRPIAPGPILITLTNAGCDPRRSTAPAGKTTFSIKNESKRAVEWEILKGVMVVDERENILPGFAQTLTATLDAGDYAMTCGLLEQPEGDSDRRRHQRRAGEALGDGPGRPDRRVQGLCEGRGRRRWSAETKKLTDAVKAGKLADAQRALRAGPSAL